MLHTPHRRGTRTLEQLDCDEGRIRADERWLCVYSLSTQLTARGLPFLRQVPLPVVYHDVKLDCGYRVDLVVGSQLVVQLKSVAALEPIHEAQLLTYMRMGRWRLGLLMSSVLSVVKNNNHRGHREHRPYICRNRCT